MRRRTKLGFTAALLMGGLGFAAGLGPAAAHEFTAAIVVSGPDAVARAAETARGFIVATDERDGHTAETSDGHLGGLDVQIRVLPPAAAAAVGELAGAPKDPADIAFVLGPETAAGNVSKTALGPDTIVFGPGALPPAAARAASGFSSRFERLYGRAPTRPAEQGYNAALRIDLAIRRSGGLSPRGAVKAVIESTAAGIDW